MNETNSPNTTNSDDRDEAQQLHVKKRKINPNDEHTLSFLLANDLSDITDYFILLFSQVTRGLSSCHRVFNIVVVGLLFLTKTITFSLLFGYIRYHERIRFGKG